LSVCIVSLVAVVAVAMFVGIVTGNIERIRLDPGLTDMEERSATGFEFHGKEDPLVLDMKVGPALGTIGVTLVSDRGCAKG
jgi:hypothetical protein